MPGAHHFCLREIPGLRRSVQTPDGSHHFLYQDGNHFLQLCIRGSPRSNWVHLLAEAVVAPDSLRFHLRSVEVLNHLWHKGKFPDHFPSIGPSSTRLRFVLRALDGRLAGASYREIAIVLIGADRVRAGWRDDNSHLKNRIRRAVLRGRILMRGGYRRLLSGVPAGRCLGCL